jgi:ABC-type uncharacterized transport system substrate-binding protein
MFLFLTSLYSHPHVFASYSFSVNFSGGYLKSVRVNWEFDVFFSSQIINQHDKNRNGRFERDEAASAKKEAFDNLENYNYFTAITVGGRNFPVKKINGFYPLIKGRKLIYSFNIPLNIKVSKKNKKVIITCKDPTIYVAFSPARSWVLLKNKSGYVVNIKKIGPSFEIFFRK